MNKYLIAGIALFGLVACNSADQFKIAGTVENAAKETMYLEHIGLLKTDLLDSVVLSKDGEFKFKAPRPEYPIFTACALVPGPLILLWTPAKLSQ